ncbi:MAG: hypothetical protein ACOY5C_10005 [Pseudomonadota bacterium]|uniref:hypothetical protein n=1 Tax=Thermithiobacillus tepidarius TaxID=929 RepID=UPI0004102685|nr:hypothetical protein [Thermithiobacillus tepidarius]
MHFQSLEQALDFLMHSEKNSVAYQEALEYCVENAPSDLRESLYSLYRSAFYGADTAVDRSVAEGRSASEHPLSTRH